MGGEKGHQVLMGCGCSTSSGKSPVIRNQPDLPLVDNLKRRVYTYFYPQGVETKDMLELWLRSWRNNGWSPVVLTPADAAQHPMHKALLLRASQLPTVNLRLYENHCYLRWLAFDVKAPGVFSDYDTINYELKPEMVERIPEGSSRICALSRCGLPNPALFAADQGGIRSMLHEFLHGTVPLDKIHERPHTSDMYYFFRIAQRNSKDQCPNAGYGKWKTAPAVHWNNDSIRRLGGDPARRSSFIQRIRPVP